MPALEPLRGLRVVADPAALDGATWEGHPAMVLRFAADEAFAIGATDVAIADDHAIVVEERGFVGARCALADIAHRIEWTVGPTAAGLLQGAVAGVPAKLLFEGGDDRVLLVAAAAHADELADRLGWSR